MAKATLVPPQPQEELIQLILTKEEAKTLRFLAGQVTGSSENSRRKHTDAIYDALGLLISSETVRKYAQFSPSCCLFFKNEEGI